MPERVIPNPRINANMTIMSGLLRFLIIIIFVLVVNELLVTALTTCAVDYNRLMRKFILCTFIT